MCLDGQVAGLGWGSLSLSLILLASVGSQVQPSLQLALLCKCPQPSTMLTPISCMRTSSIYKLCRNQHSPPLSPPLCSFCADYFVSNGLLLYLPLLHLLTAIRILSKIHRTLPFFHYSHSRPLSFALSPSLSVCKFPIRVQVFAHCSWRC